MAEKCRRQECLLFVAVVAPVSELLVDVSRRGAGTGPACRSDWIDDVTRGWVAVRLAVNAHLNPH
jgi:hypothetical protein